VDIKKHSGNSNSDDREIREESHQNAPILNAQIRGLHPTVIVAGGNVCWHSLIYDLGLFTVAPECPKFQAVLCNSMVLCYANHPAARRGAFSVHALHNAVLGASIRITQPHPA
jgi:uracil-DNA glycosylase